jgi:cytochrome c553
MPPFRFLLAAAVAAAALPVQAAGDAAAGAKKNFQCQGCHGVADWKTAYPELYSVPKLGGQKAAYIVSALKAYKAGEREPGPEVAAAQEGLRHALSAGSGRRGRARRASHRGRGT